VKRHTWALAGVAGQIAAAVIGNLVAVSSAKQEVPAAQSPPATTAKVKQGKLSDTVAANGILIYRARPDGLPYAVINRAGGTYTMLPEVGDKVGCGGVLYRVDDSPVMLLCGTVPVYRKLSSGDVGSDVHQLNVNLHQLGYDGKAHVAIDPGDTHFTVKTKQALALLQQDKGFDVTGALELGQAVFLPEAVRIVRVIGELGGAAQRVAPVTQGTSDTLVLQATSDTLIVQVNLEPSQQGEVRVGARAQITLPGNTLVRGAVERLGRVATVPDGKDGESAAATIPASIRFDDPQEAGGLDRAPVQVNIITEGVESALSVPVTALVGKSGGGFAVEVVRGGERELVTVRLGLFDTAGGRVQVEGRLREGDDVVVPSL